MEGCTIERDSHGLWEPDTLCIALYTTAISSPETLVLTMPAGYLLGGKGDFANKSDSLDETSSVAKTSESSIRLTGLSGLKQAIAILHHIDIGKAQTELVKMCDDDLQLVIIWIEFMIELKWLERKGITSTAGSFGLTAQGKEALKKYFFS